MRGHRRTSRRGFLIVSVLVLMLIVVVVASWMLSTSTVRANVAQQQLNAYRDHHDLMSVRHIARSYMRRIRSNSDLEDIVGEPQVRREREPVVYQAELPDGLSVQISVSRAQGTVLRDLEGAESGAQRMLLSAILTDLDATGEAAEFTRSIGPSRIVLPSAPDRVLRAIAGDSSGVFETLRACRLEGVTNPGLIQTRLQSAGIDAETAGNLASRLFTSETRLWRLRVLAERDSNRREYHLYMMREGATAAGFWEILEARMLTPDNEEAAP